MSHPLVKASTGGNRRQRDRHRPWWQLSLFERFSIGAQVAGFVITLALIVVGLSYRAYVTSAQALIRQAESSNLTGAAHVAQARIEAESRVLTASSQALASHPAVRQALQDDNAAAMTLARGEFERSFATAGFSLLHLIDRSRVIVHRAAQPGLPTGKAAVWGISEALAGDTLLQTTKDINGGLVIHSMVPVRGSDDSVVGVVMAGTRFDNGFARRIGQDGGVELAFATPNGVVARSSDRFLNAPALHRQPLETALFERRPFLAFDLDHAILRQYVPVKLGDETFVLIVQGDAAAAQARVVVAARQALQSSAALLGFAIVAACLFALMLASRLRRVRNQAEVLAHDITGTDVALQPTGELALPNCRSELAVLEHVFDRTALAVERHHEALNEAKERAEHAANYDALTGLPNRAMLMKRLDRRMKDQPDIEWALLFLDLDGFKQVNDCFGHHAGDALLSQVASRLQALVPDPDDVARLGGDEFVIIAQPRHGTTPADLAKIARRLAGEAIGALEQPFIVDDSHMAEVSASVGIALYPEHGADPSTMLKRADIALYAAKHAGRRTACFYGSPTATDMRSLALAD